MDKPDKIWAWPDDIENGFMAASHVGEPPTPDYSGSHTTYLSATPERELASELVEALRGMTYLVSGNSYNADKARAVLAKLEGKG